MNLLCGTRPWTETVWRTLRTTHPECEWWMARTMRDLTWKLEASPPWVFVLHWHWKIPAMWLSRARWIGFHASDLPHFRGGSPIRNQQQRGRRTTQLTAFQLEAGLDTGPIVLQRPLSLAGSEAAVLARCAELVPGMIDDLLAGRYTARAQSGEGSTYRRADACGRS